MIVMMDFSNYYQKEVNVATTYFGYHKTPNPCCHGYSGYHRNIATGSLSCHVHRTQHRRARLPKGGCAHAGEIVATMVNSSETRNAHQEKDKDYLMLPIFQKYAVPYTESSPRRVTRKAVASCTFVLASDPGDLQR